MPLWALPALSWLVSFYFLCGFTVNVGFPPDRSLLLADVVYVGLWLLFLFLPFFKKIKLGTMLELEREIEKAKEAAHSAKESLIEFKADVRSTLQVLSTNVNTIGGMTNQVTFNIPGLNELQNARQIVETKAPETTKQKAQAVENLIHWQNDDPTLALAKLRIEIERLLRRGLSRRIKLVNSENNPIKYMSLHKLFESFLEAYPDHAWLRGPFKSAIAVSNAAIHAQRVPAEEAEEALSLGAEIIATLQALFPEPEDS